MSNLLTFRDADKIHRDELHLVSSSLEELCQVVGIERVNGEWKLVVRVMIGGIAVDILVAFNPGGNLPSEFGLGAIPYANELGEMEMLAIRKALRDYHPDVLVDGGQHVSYCQTYNALKNMQSEAPFILSAQTIGDLGKTDAEVFTPAALRAGFTIDKVLDGLNGEWDYALDFVPVWAAAPNGEAHASQSSKDSWYHPDFKHWKWEEFRKGFHIPWIEMFGGFFTNKGPKTSAGLHEQIKAFANTRGYLAGKVLVIFGHVTEYCDKTTIYQALVLGYTVIIAYDAMAPFNVEDEASVLYEFYVLSQTKFAGKLYLASNETLKEVNEIWKFVNVK